MNTVRVVTVAGIGWLPILAIAAWWAGFAPFPTRPESIGVEQTSNHFADQTGSDQTTERWVPTAAAAEKGCDDTRTGDAESDKNFTITCWRVQSGVPFYGLGSPHWILQALNYENRPSVLMGLYRSYAACMLAKDRVAKEDTKTFEWNVEHAKEPITWNGASYYCEPMPKR